MLGKAQGTSCPDSRASTGSRHCPALSPHHTAGGDSAADYNYISASAGIADADAQHSIPTVADTERARRSSARARHTQIRKARREWIVRVGEAPADLPCWTSREGWLDELANWLATEEGLAACARVHIRPDRVLRAAVALAAHADHTTGRNCAVTNTTAGLVAQCSPRTLTTARGVLGTSGFAVEVYRGTATPSCGRRPSVWHLISRRNPVDNSAAETPICALPPSRRDRRLPPDSSHSPSGRIRVTRSKSQSPQKNKSTTGCPTPRPLHVQQLAAGIVAGSQGLNRGHIGRICDAFTRSHLDLNAWTAKQLLVALNDDMRTRRSSWPDRIHNPAGFLASRLQHLPERPKGISQAANIARRSHTTAPTLQEHAPTSRDVEHGRVLRWHADVVAATTRQERTRLLHAHSVKFGRVLDPVAALAGAGRRSTRLFPHLPLASALSMWADDMLAKTSKDRSAKQIPLSWGQSAERPVDPATEKCDCVVCGAPQAPSRPQLPLKALSAVCDRCWPVIAADLADSSAVDEGMPA